MEKKSIFGEMRRGDTYLYYHQGQWKVSNSGNTIPIYNPWDNSIVGKIQACSRQEADEVIATARQQRDCWIKTPLRDRAMVLAKAAQIMDEHAEEIGHVLVKEIGKPIKQAISEITRTAEIFRFTQEAGVQLAGETIAGDAFSGSNKGKISITTRVPLGVVLCIGPFNYPFNLTGSKIAPALIAGNTVVMKPPTQGALAALHFGKILELAGLPPGVFNIITGKGSEIGDYLVGHPGIDMISFTGSTEVGVNLAKVAGMKPLLLELGGKDAAIVLDDADLDLTVKNIVSGAFSYSGQRCTAVKRLLPLPKIADKLVDAVVDETLKLSVGNPAENKSIGPLISSKQCDYVQGLIDDALNLGAKLRCGNKREGNVMWPTVLDHVTTDMRIAWEEPFGPVLPIIRVKTIEDAIHISNKSEYGLQGMIFTHNIDLAFNIAQELEVGTVQINGQSARGPDHFPFLGAKSSGLGTQGIKYSIEAMSRPKSVVMNLSERGKLVPWCSLDSKK
jgi:glyceraldehyde-3-phosphate dehydrogenase (NADP+)